MVPVDMIYFCKQFKVYTARSLVNDFCDMSDIDVNIAGGIPDHSALVPKNVYRVYVLC